MKTKGDDIFALSPFPWLALKGYKSNLIRYNTSFEGSSHYRSYLNRMLAHKLTQVQGQLLCFINKVFLYLFVSSAYIHFIIDIMFFSHNTIENFKQACHLPRFGIQQTLGETEDAYDTQSYAIDVTQTNPLHVTQTNMDNIINTCPSDSQYDTQTATVHLTQTDQIDFQASGKVVPIVFFKTKIQNRPSDEKSHFI